MPWDPWVWALSVLGGLSVAVAIASLIDGVRFRSKVRDARVWDHTAFLPPALLLVPCRGVDAGLEENLDMILRQEYPAYRVVFCVDAMDDAAIAAIERVRPRHTTPSDISVANQDPAIGGKALALLGGLQMRTPRDEVIAFLDSDIRPSSRFLRSLVQPLAHPQVGATTTYRWYVPVRGGLWSAVRSAWNAAGLNIFFNDRYNFLWGGAWAIRRHALERLDLAALWRGTLSEDLAVTAAIKAMGLRVQFVPQSVASTLEDCTRKQCVEWTTRQTAMVAVWGRHIRNFAALMYGVHLGAVLLGLFCIGLTAFADPRFAWPTALFLVHIPATIVKGAYRRNSVFLGNPEIAKARRVSTVVWAIANLLVPWLVLWNLLRTRNVETIEWRGKRYRLTPGALETSDQRM